MDRDLLTEFWPVFSAEAAEHLQTIGAGILELEKRPAARSAARFEETCRAAHSLKGTAGSLGLFDIEKLAHVIEEAILARGKTERLPSASAEAALAAVAAIEEALATVPKGGDASVPTLASLVARLRGHDEPAAPPHDEASNAVAELWPVFRDELRAGARRLRDRSLPHAETEAALTLLRETAATLGATGLAHVVAVLSAAVGAGRDDERGRALDQLEEAFSALDVNVAEPPVELRASGLTREISETFRSEVRASIGVLERAVAKLCSPAAGEHGAVLEEATRHAHNLKGSSRAFGAAAMGDFASRLEEKLRALSTPGANVSRGAPAIAELVIDLQDAVARLGIALPSREAAEPAAPKALDRSVRVSLRTLDSLGEQLEQLLLGRGRHERRTRELEELAAEQAASLVQLERGLAALRSDALPEDLVTGVRKLRSLRSGLQKVIRQSAREVEQLELISTVVREDLRNLRMTPAGTILEPLRRTVRDVAGRLSKHVELELHGGDVRLDRRILDELKDPLLHLVRNSIDHGLEAREVRLEAGKSANGTLEIRVEQRGHRIAIVVRDDGAGLSYERIRATAVRRGLLTEAAASALDDAETARLIFHAGFSTAEAVTQISGRGVGLDVVHDAVSRLQGAIDIRTTQGKGTEFTLDLPLTLAATQGCLVRVGGERFIVPGEAVERVLRVSKANARTIGGRPVLVVEKENLQLTFLGQTLRQPRARTGLSRELVPMLLMAVGGARGAVIVDEVIGQVDVVVQPLGRFLDSTRQLSGAAVLDDGSVVPVLSPADIVRGGAQLPLPAPQTKAKLLVVDDSLTTRMAMKAVLEMAGYLVVACGDGTDALRLLEEETFALVVSDVQMPGLDGFGLTRAIRSESRLAGLPIVLVTSLSGDEDRATGISAGADAYLIKRDVERGRLLEVVRQFLPQAS